MDDRILERAARPIILLDGVPVGVQLEAWINTADDGDPRLPEARLRLAELLRPIDPERALTFLEGAPDPGRAAAVRAAAALELADPAGAAAFIPQVPMGPARDLLEARYALLTRRFDEARVAFDLLLAGFGIPADVEAEALSFRMRLRGRDGLAAGMEDLERLEQVCLREQATWTGIWIGLLKGVFRSQGFEAAAKLFGAAELAALMGDVTQGVSDEGLGGVPVWVHGAVKKYKDDPTQLAEVLILLTAHLWRLGQHVDAVRTLELGGRIVARVQPAAREALEQFRVVMRARVGVDAYEAALAQVGPSSG